MTNEHENPLVNFRNQINDLIGVCRDECKTSRKNKVVSTQIMKVDGKGNTARQGDIIVNIVQQEVLIGLIDLRDKVDDLINNGILISDLNLMRLSNLAQQKALALCNGEKRKAAEMLGVHEKTLAKRLNCEPQNHRRPRKHASI